MLQIVDLRKTYGLTTVLDGVSFVLNDGEKVGLIGPNGVGKSTLLRCLVGEERADSGTIVRSPPNLVLGYLPQATNQDTSSTIKAVLARSLGDWFDARAILALATDGLSTAGDDRSLQAYDDAFARFEAAGGYEREHQLRQVLDGLGLGDLHEDTPVAHLSGGQKTRLALASLLTQNASVLILDEPTNHLDVAGLEWLEGFVRTYPGSAVVASHDREFLNHTVGRVLYLDLDTRTVRSYVGTYDDFASARRREGERQAELWTRQHEYVSRVQSDISRLKGEALAVERSTSSRQPGVKKLAKHKARLAKSREHKLERYLESDARVEKPALNWGLHLDFGDPPASGRSVVRLTEVSYGYLDQAEILRDLNLEIRAGERVAITGPNGSGKTTLLRLISGELRPRCGQVVLGANVRPGVLAQEQETLDPARTVMEITLAARAMSHTEARNFLHFFLFQGDDVFREVGKCSLGEQTRLQLALLVLRGCNLLLLDEPLNHLDIEGREHFEEALRAFAGTVVVVAHDRAFLQSYAERIVDTSAWGR